MFAPIILFAYNRPAHLSQTLHSLKSDELASVSDLTIYCDGPRGEMTAQIEEVRRIARGADGFRSVRIVTRDENLGLARSIIGGVTEALEESDRVIVVEDDLRLSRHFLTYMNDALECYAEDERVASIHGYCYPCKAELPETFFLRGADCWGWATWRRAWPTFEEDGAALLDELKRRKLKRAFDLDGAHHFTAMLEDQVAGVNDSWAIRWHAANFLAGKLTLYPGRSLVHNLGNDGSGTHGHNRETFDCEVQDSPVTVEPIPVEESVEARRTVARFLRRSLPARVAWQVRRWLR